MVSMSGSMQGSAPILRFDEVRADELWVAGPSAVIVMRPIWAVQCHLILAHVAWIRVIHPLAWVNHHSRCYFLNRDNCHSRVCLWTIVRDPDVHARSTQHQGMSGSHPP